jgi:periplasmic protein TonB
MYSEDNRVFHYAVAASIVLHALMLFGVSQRDRARPAAPPVPLIARLVELPAPTPAAAPPARQVEPAKPRPRPKPVAPKPVAKEEPAPRPEPAAEPAAEEPPVAQIEAAAPASGPVAPPVIARADPAPAPAAPMAPAAAEPVEDPGSLAKYRQQLILAAPQYKRYPRIAQDNNWQGNVAVRMVIGPGGTVSGLTVLKSSGYDVLDQQALQMFRHAAAAVPVPPVLRGKQFAVDVAATYYFTD